MSRIVIKFTPTMELLTDAGLKTATTRDEMKGAVGDTFLVRGRLYELDNILALPLGAIRDRYHLFEGFTSPKQFERYWRSLFGSFPDWDIRYIHFFVRLP